MLQPKSKQRTYKTPFANEFSFPNHWEIKASQSRTCKLNAENKIRKSILLIWSSNHFSNSRFYIKIIIF